MTVALVLHRADGAPVSTSFRRAAFGKDDPFARHREIAWEGPELDDRRPHQLHR